MNIVKYKTKEKSDPLFLRVSASSNTFTRTDGLSLRPPGPGIAFGCHFIIDTIVKEVRRAIVGLLDRLIAHILIPFFLFVYESSHYVFVCFPNQY